MPDDYKGYFEPELVTTEDYNGIVNTMHLLVATLEFHYNSKIDLIWLDAVDDFAMIWQEIMQKKVYLTETHLHYEKKEDPFKNVHLAGFFLDLYYVARKVLSHSSTALASPELRYLLPKPTPYEIEFFASAPLAENDQKGILQAPDSTLGTHGGQLELETLNTLLSLLAEPTHDRGERAVQITSGSILEVELEPSPAEDETARPRFSGDSHGPDEEPDTQDPGKITIQTYCATTTTTTIRLIAGTEDRQQPALDKHAPDGEEGGASDGKKDVELESGKVEVVVIPRDSKDVVIEVLDEAEEGQTGGDGIQGVRVGLRGQAGDKETRERKVKEAPHFGTHTGPNVQTWETLQIIFEDPRSPSSPSFPPIAKARMACMPLFARNAVMGWSKDMRVDDGVVDPHVDIHGFERELDGLSTLPIEAYSIPADKPTVPTVAPRRHLPLLALAWPHVHGYVQTPPLATAFDGRLLRQHRNVRSSTPFRNEYTLEYSAT
ncbi:hypothetical protein OF83DRAFT_1178286 [Amylostereum chailletii]|nr:hypothetical protein OF83DRAFT_1178286 [Amylostereum chailletii]